MYQNQGQQNGQKTPSNQGPGHGQSQGQGQGQNGGGQSQAQNQSQGGQGQNQNQGHNNNHPPGRPFLRNPQVNNPQHHNNLLNQNNKGKAPGKGAYQSSSNTCWTSHNSNPYQNNHHQHPPPGQNQGQTQGQGHSQHGHGSSMGVLSGRNNLPQGGGCGLGRSYSMSSFHPPLCAYTPSPGLGFGAWAKGPPAGLTTPTGRGPTMIPNYPPPHHGSGGGPPNFSIPVPQHHNNHPGGHPQGHIGFSSQFPFYYNAVPSGPAGHGHSSPLNGPPVQIIQPGAGNSPICPPGPAVLPNMVIGGGPCLLVPPSPGQGQPPQVQVTSSSSAGSSGETSTSLSTSGSASASSSSRPGSSGSGGSLESSTSGSGSGNGKSDAAVTASSSSSGSEAVTNSSTPGTTSSTSSSEKDAKLKLVPPPTIIGCENKPPPPTPVFRMTTDVSITHNLCAFCCKKNARLCTGCRHVAYCSEKCQLLHWPDHKWKCDPPVIVDQILAIETMRREKEKGNPDNSQPVEIDEMSTTTSTCTLTPMKQGKNVENVVLNVNEVEKVEIKQPEVSREKSVESPKILPRQQSPRQPQRYNSFVKVMNLSGLSQEKLEFRSKIAQLSAVLADSLGVSTAAKLYEEESHSPFILEEEKTELSKLPDNSELSLNPESEPSTPRSISKSSSESDNADESQTEPNSNPTKVGYTGRMLTRKEIPPCGLVASISPIMITCCNTMLTPPPPDSVICLNCMRWYQSSLGYRCTTCRWPVCSMECEMSYLHSSFECKVFSASKRLPPSLKEHTQFFNDIVLVIRCLLLKSVDLPKYNELFELMEFCDPTRPGPNEKAEDSLRIDKKILNYLKNECAISNWTELDGSELLTFINVVDVCSIVVQDRIFIQVQDQGKSYYAPKFVFPMKIYMNQDCIPNCKWSIKHSPKFEDCFLRIHAAVPLPPHTYVTTCFNSDQHVIGSWFQNDLSTSKFKNRCCCSRCRDPTEGGSFFSGVACTTCNSKNECDSSQGYLLPQYPLVSSSDWVCHNPSCDKTMEGSKMRAKILGMHDEIHNTNTHEDFYALVHLKWRLEGELHKNHFLLLKISVICVMLFWGCVRGLPFFSPRYDFFISTINLAQEALRIYDFICPGMSIQRARILFQLQVAFAYKHLRDIRRYMEWGGDKMSSLHKQSPTPGFPISFWELMKLQQEAQSVLITEPYGTMENEMAVVLQEVIDDQKDLLSNCLKEVNLEMTAVYNLHKIYTRFSNQYYYPAVPIYEDKDIQEFEVMTGPCARHLLEKINFPF